MRSYASPHPGDPDGAEPLPRARWKAIERQRLLADLDEPTMLLAAAEAAAAGVPPGRSRARRVLARAQRQVLGLIRLKDLHWQLWGLRSVQDVQRQMEDEARKEELIHQIMTTMEKPAQSRKRAGPVPDDPAPRAPGGAPPADDAPHAEGAGPDPGPPQDGPGRSALRTPGRGPNGANEPDRDGPGAIGPAEASPAPSEPVSHVPGRGGANEPEPGDRPASLQPRRSLPDPPGPSASRLTGFHPDGGRPRSPGDPLIPQGPLIETRLGPETLVGTIPRRYVW